MATITQPEIANDVKTGGLTLPTIAPAPGVASSPTKTPVPDVGGTLTVSPKAPAIPAPTPDNSAGLYSRTGVTPPSPLTVTPPQATNGNNGYYKDVNNNVYDAATNQKIDQATFQAKGLNIDHINLGSAPAAPAVPSYDSSSAQKTALQKTVDDFSSQLDEITKQIASSKTPTQDELDLQTKLQTAKSALDSFDTETLARANNYSGQGRGQTTAFVELNKTQDARTRALQRLGMAQDVTNLTAQLGLKQDARKASGDVATAEESAASKKFDAILGVQKEMDALDTQTQTKARQYLLDVVDFAKGKTFDQLDPETQAQITMSVANSPITLGMIKTSLENSKGNLTYETRDVGGRTIRFGFDNKGNEVSKTDLGASSSGTKTTDIFGDAKNIIQQYKENGIDRAAIEQQYKDASKAIPPEVTKALDELYPAAATPAGGKVWYNPFTWLN